MSTQTSSNGVDSEKDKQNVVGTNGTNQKASKKLDKLKEKRKLKKKKQKERKRNDASASEAEASEVESSTDIEQNKKEDVVVEYVTEDPLQEITADPNFEEFAEVFKNFSTMGADEGQVVPGSEQSEQDNADQNEEDSEEKKMSNKQKKREKRLSIAVLKQLVKRPDVIEAWDVTSADPALLVYLKSYKNTVAVPRHWNQKRKYLQGKRGIEKPAFQLPDFIAATGISRVRGAIQEKEDSKNAKQKARERMAPKVGRSEIDYQVLHDAFFKFQTKPKLTIHGDLYYEGKEFEITLKEKRPGHLSDDLKKALGMPEGAPPPWLINMQRYGPPPSYPRLKIPGLNAPLPEGARWGYHAGGWGKPPVDEFGRPLYGDVFGTTAPEPPPEILQPIEKNRWGELEEEVEEETAEEAMQPPAADEEEPSASGLETPTGYETPSAGMETPDSLELRKSAKSSSSSSSKDDDDSNKQLFQVLQQASMAVGSSIYGSAHKYVLPGSERRETKHKTVDLIKSQKTDKIDVALNPDEVENLEQLSQEDFKRKLDAALAEKQEVREDVSDIIAEHSKKKRKKDTKDSKSKKYKDYKF